MSDPTAPSDLLDLSGVDGDTNPGRKLAQDGVVTAEAAVQAEPGAATEHSTRVTIDTPGPTITVEAHASLDVVAAKAMELFRLADAMDRGKSPGPGTGFSAERSSW